MKNIIVLCSLILILTSFKFFSKERCEIPQDEKIVNKLMSYTAKQLSNEYGMEPAGIRVGMPGGIVKCLGLEFNMVGPMSKDEIRKILIYSSDAFLSIINNDVNIRPHLECFPFTKEKIEIVLYFDRKNGTELQDPDISIASIRKNNLQYTTFSATVFPMAKDRYSESEQDALEALKKLKK